MDFGVNKTPAEAIKEGAFGGSYFRDIYSVTEKWYKNSWKEFDQFKDIYRKYYYSEYYDMSVNKYDVKCGTTLRFWKVRVGLIKLIFMVGFSGISSTCWVEDQKMIKDKSTDGKKL